MFDKLTRLPLVLITGPSHGSLGAEVVLSLAKESPSTLILAGRDHSKVEPVIHRVKVLDEKIQVVFVPVDFSDLDSVRSAAADVSNKVEHIDVLINNAGIMACPYHTTKDGLESQFGTNHIGPFLFTNLLLPKLYVAGSGMRIVNVSSSLHRLSGIHFQDIGFEVYFSFFGDLYFAY